LLTGPPNNNIPVDVLNLKHRAIFKCKGGYDKPLPTSSIAVAATAVATTFTNAATFTTTVTAATVWLADGHHRGSPQPRATCERCPADTPQR
jgi:hypothetical protein